MTPARITGVVVAVAVLVILVAVGSTGGWLATADRDLNADVVSDDQALFGFHVSETVGTVGGPSFELLAFVDNSDGAVTVDTVTVQNGPIAVADVTLSGATVTCTAPTSGPTTATVVVTASGPDVQITVYREIPVTCSPPVTTP